MPVFWLAAYSWCYKVSEAVERSDRIVCMHGKNKKTQYQESGIMWMSLYFITPAILLVTFNIAIVVRLRRVMKNHRVWLSRKTGLSTEKSSHTTSTLVTSADNNRDTASTSSSTTPSVTASTTKLKTETTKMPLEVGIRYDIYIYIYDMLLLIIISLYAQPFGTRFRW